MPLLQKRVVICFHSLIYWYFTQPPCLRLPSIQGCDLLSFFDLLIFHTADLQYKRHRRRLWFAFILWFIDISHSSKSKTPSSSNVVICFHSLIYWYFTQQEGVVPVQNISCDLLSFFDLLIFHTAYGRHNKNKRKLWFAFILWFIDISHSRAALYVNSKAVVICFHSLIYWYFTQHRKNQVQQEARCDLLSFFDLLIFHTADDEIYNDQWQLWFAFILWFIDISHSNLLLLCFRRRVVICFHSLIYWYFTQPRQAFHSLFRGCDLLSFFDLLIFHTASNHKDCRWT